MDSQNQKRPYKEKVISLHSDRKLIHAVKKAGLETFHPQGSFNGYGYESLPLAVRITSLGEMRKFNKIKREVENRPAAREKTLEEIKAAWARRLVRLAGEEEGIDFDEAMDMANAKLEYKQDQITALVKKQNDRYSPRREKLIDQIQRSNPLRYIIDEDHAVSIIYAHRRHTKSNYEMYLATIHEMEDDGFIERGEAKDLAKQCINKDQSGDIQDGWEFLNEILH